MSEWRKKHQEEKWRAKRREWVLVRGRRNAEEVADPSEYQVSSTFDEEDDIY
jgi:hypothetical protein